MPSSGSCFVLFFYDLALSSLVASCVDLRLLNRQKEKQQINSNIKQTQGKARYVKDRQVRTQQEPKYSLHDSIMPPLQLIKIMHCFFTNRMYIFYIIAPIQWPYFEKKGRECRKMSPSLSSFTFSSLHLPTSSRVSRVCDFFTIFPLSTLTSSIGPFYTPSSLKSPQPLT